MRPKMQPQKVLIVGEVRVPCGGFRKLLSGLVRPLLKSAVEHLLSGLLIF